MKPEKLLTKNGQKPGGRRPGAGRRPETPGEPKQKKSFAVSERTLTLLKVLGAGNMSKGLEIAVDAAYEQYQRGRL